MSYFDDLVESGALCMGCGAYIGKDISGYCSNGCKVEFTPPFKAEKVKCSKCEKMLTPSGVKQHMEAKHEEPEQKASPSPQSEAWPIWPKPKGETE